MKSEIKNATVLRLVTGLAWSAVSMAVFVQVWEPYVTLCDELERAADTLQAQVSDLETTIEVIEGERGDTVPPLPDQLDRFRAVGRALFHSGRVRRHCRSWH